MSYADGSIPNMDYYVESIWLLRHFHTNIVKIPDDLTSIFIFIFIEEVFFNGFQSRAQMGFIQMILGNSKLERVQCLRNPL